MVGGIPKYSKEYDSQSIYGKELRDRSTVNSCLFTSGGKKKMKCDLCQQTLKTPAGQTYLQCQSCGKIYDPETIKQQQDKKILSDPNTKTTGIIVSQTKKKRRGSSLDNEFDSETEEDLAALGFGRTATLKDYFI